MNCPSCPAKPLALFICDDGVHRCYSCKSKRPISTVFPLQPAPGPSFAATPGPAQGQPYKSPYVSHSSNQRARSKGRLQVLGMIETEIREKMKFIESHKGWQKLDRFSSAHYACSECIKIIQDHHVITADGKPMGRAG